jgi:hypothetical protein
VNPTPQQIQAIKAFVGGLAGGFAANTGVQIRAAMTSTLVPNPITAAPQVPKPFTYDDLVSAAGIDATAKTNIATLAATIGRFLEDIDAQDVNRLQRWGRILLHQGKITAAQATAMNGVVAAKIGDPNWSATVPWDVANLGRVADDFDIEAARHG